MMSLKDKFMYLLLGVYLFLVIGATDEFYLLPIREVLTALGATDGVIMALSIAFIGWAMLGNMLKERFFKEKPEPDPKKPETNRVLQAITGNPRKETLADIISRLEPHLQALISNG